MKNEGNIDFRATTTSRHTQSIVEMHRHGRYPLFQRGLGGFSSKFHILDRGYTGHEHLLDHDIINMNGRIYDPIVGQFMQADNYIQSPEDFISYNRYSYCLYNPFKYTDPSGEFWCGPAGGVKYWVDEIVVSGTEPEPLVIQPISTVVPYISSINSTPMEYTSNPHFYADYDSPVILWGPTGATSSGIGFNGNGSSGGDGYITNAFWKELNPTTKKTKEARENQPNLGPLGNKIKSYIESDYGKKLFNNFWQNGGDIILTQERFNDILKHAGKGDVLRTRILKNGDKLEVKVHNFYKSKRYATAFGRALIYYVNNIPVGFYDYYNFNIEKDGVRPKDAERNTRLVNTAGKLHGARPFNIIWSK